ncbi:YoaK family protein [Mucilaginibacter sp. McL0603]|uniref:YoaK family protein n=1 Tax=Mucilaginibacter sp. McL0603 TaxID=3415670 RepID=UPI003CEB363C
MVDEHNNIRNFSLLLALTAGFCDAITFITADEFSAHVTGNFILFAYDVIKGADSQSWAKLITLPVFIIAVITGGWLINKTSSKRSILLLEGFILLATGLVAFVLKFENISLGWLAYGIVMPVVFAMGLQNAFGKLYSKETYGPTTMMTGNVTQAALDFLKVIKTKFSDSLIIASLKHQSLIIGGFLVGCLLGAMAGKVIGLGGLLLPGIVLIIYPKKDLVA